MECNGLAKDYWNKDYWNACTECNYGIPNPIFGNEGWSVWIEGKKLTKMDRCSVYEYLFSPRTHSYWKCKHQLMDELITSINWDACHQSITSLPFGKRRWLVKHVTGFCGVGKMELLRGNQDHDECPRCGLSEDAPHVVHCKGEGTEFTFTLALHNLEITL